jgi:hypothetical protein
MRDRDGFALVTSLLVVIVLALLAVGAVVLSSTEKRTSFAESVHVEAVYSADSGGEAAVNFLRLCDTPPRIVDFGDNMVRSEDDQVLHGSQQYGYECNYVRKRPRPGWGVEYLDYDYRVNSDGEAAAGGHSDVQLVAGRLFREGY